MKILVLELVALAMLGMQSSQLLAEEGQPEVNPAELAETWDKCWNWIESLSDFQPYLPAEMPPPKQMIHWSLVTARKCKLRGQNVFGLDRITNALAGLGDKEGLLDTFREFGIAPRDQVFSLAILTVATKSEPMPIAAFGGDADHYHSYCVSLLLAYERAREPEKAIEISRSLLRDPFFDDEVLSYAKAERFDKVLEILNSLRAEGKPYQHEYALAPYLLDAGESDEARKLLPYYLASVRKLDTPDERLDYANLWGTKLVKRLGDAAQQRTFLEDCVNWEQEANAGDADPLSKASRSHSLARIAVTLGDNELAKKCLSRAIEFVGGASERMPVRLAQYASFQASLGLEAESKQTAKQALSAARANPDEEKRVSDVSGVAEYLAKYRNESLIGEIDAILGEIHGVAARAQAIRYVVMFEIEHEQWQRAKRHLAEGRDFLSRKEIDPAEARIEQFKLDLLAANLAAKQGDETGARRLLKELFERGYSPKDGALTEKVFSKQYELRFLKDAWRTGTWIPELDRRLNAMSEITKTVLYEDAERKSKELKKKGPSPK
jgi:hypothetical protein